MTEAGNDVIDRLAGIVPGSPLDAIRARRPEARSQSQASYRALFEPEDPAGFAPAERFAVAVFVARLHGAADVADFYRAQLPGSGAGAGLADAVEAAAAEAAGEGPYGCYPAGPLRREDQPGPVYHPGDTTMRQLGPRLAAAAAHLHLVVLHPRDAHPASLQGLLDAGWSTTAIVTLSQIAAFLSYQIRVVAGLRVLAGHV